MRRPDESRWKRLLNENDSKAIWKAINWKGSIEEVNADHRPTDDDFKAYLDLKRPAVEGRVPDHDSNTYIPVLDDPISSAELSTQIRKMKTNKASGPDGIPASIFKSMPAQWILFLTSLFNLVFYSGEYPRSWSTAKLSMIFKKGNRLLPENYRGISVVNSIAKLYDMILCSRLESWYTPHREQAGAQRGRGCAENILALRLITDYARRKKKLLYVTFVDFSSAYDLIPRQLMLNVLRELGCGAAFLAAIAATTPHHPVPARHRCDHHGLWRSSGHADLLSAVPDLCSQPDQNGQRFPRSRRVPGLATHYNAHGRHCSYGYKS